MLLLSALRRSRSPFQKEQSEPFAEHKGYPWSKVTTMARHLLSFFCAPLERNVKLASWMSDWVKKHLRLCRNTSKERPSAVIWPHGRDQVTICRRHRLTLQHGSSGRSVENDRSLPGTSGMSILFQAGAMPETFLSLALPLSPACLSCFWCGDVLEGFSQQNTLRSKDQNVFAGCHPFSEVVQ